MAVGILAGYPMIDVKATLFDGSYHDVDLSELAYKIAASKALTKAKDLIGTVLLEPIMDVSVVVPSDHMGDVIGDLSRRRGLISDQEQRNDGAVIALELKFLYQKCLVIQQNLDQWLAVVVHIKCNLITMKNVQTALLIQSLNVETFKTKTKINNL